MHYSIQNNSVLELYIYQGSHGCSSFPMSRLVISIAVSLRSFIQYRGWYMYKVLEGRVEAIFGVKSWESTIPRKWIPTYRATNDYQSRPGQSISPYTSDLPTILTCSSFSLCIQNSSRRRRRSSWLVRERGVEGGGVHCFYQFKPFKLYLEGLSVYRSCRLMNDTRTIFNVFSLLHIWYIFSFSSIEIMTKYNRCALKKRIKIKKRNEICNSVVKEIIKTSSFRNYFWPAVTLERW